MVTKTQPLSLPIDLGIGDQAIHEEIATRAYEIFEARGGDHGSDLDDWLQAEEEFMRSRFEDRR